MTVAGPGTPTGLETWLAERLADAPASLRERILEAVRGARDAGPGGSREPPIARQLRELAGRLLAQAKSGAPTHDTALTLLAADALITFAMEATAERDPAALGEVEV